MKAFILSTDKDLMASMQRICEANKPSVAIIPSVPSMQAEGGLNALNSPDLILLDADEPFVLDAASLHSRSKNTPFDQARLQGRVHRTLVAGLTVHEM